MVSVKPCVACQIKPADDAVICRDCWGKHEARLRAVPWLLAELDVNLGRRGKKTLSAGVVVDVPGSREPLDMGVLKIKTELLRAVQQWVLLTRTWDGGGDIPATVEDKVNYLVSRKDRLVRRASTESMIRDVSRAVESARRTIDQPRRRVFAGHCPTIVDGKECGVMLTAPVGALETVCRYCGHVFDVLAWRTDASQWALNQSVTATDASRILTDPATGQALPVRTIRSWERRGILKPTHTAPNRYQVRKLTRILTRQQGRQKQLRHTKTVLDSTPTAS